MTWLLIVVLGATISTSEVTYAQCIAGLRATEQIAEAPPLRLTRPAAFCIGPNGEIVLSVGLPA